MSSREGSPLDLREGAMSDMIVAIAISHNQRQGTDPPNTGLRAGLLKSG